MTDTAKKLLPSINSPADLKSLTDDELVQLASEVREQIVGAVCETGGHLASNLGTVELAIALHRVFDTPTDKIVWDVGHQAYPHKVLTGRRDEMAGIRQYGGIAGYCKRTESEYDTFGAGHASTSISAALGFATARDLQGEDHKVVAVIGDGSMTGGLAFEAMNNTGTIDTDMLVILNDNTWSISKNVGSISTYLSSIFADEKLVKLRGEIWEFLGKVKVGDSLRDLAGRVEDSIKGLLTPGMLFEKLGFQYFGPMDGHDLPQLVKMLTDLKHASGPVMLHIGTVKGKGYEPAEHDAFKYHGVSQFDKVTGVMATGSSGNPAYTKIFGQAMVELGRKHDDIVAITAAMAAGTGLVEFGEQFPDRFFDVGIAEAHGACFGAGLACNGIKPYVTIYSTFLQRAYDQVIHDMAIQNLPVVICMDRAGVVGNDGPTHHGVFDIAYLSTVPNLTLAAPKDGNELRAMLNWTATNDIDGIVALRYPRDTSPTPVDSTFHPIQWGTWERMTDPARTTILATGALVTHALHAAERLAATGEPVAVVNARFLKPFDFEMLDDVLRESRAIVTIEEGQIRGGFGQAIAAYAMQHGYSGRLKTLGISDQFVTHGTRGELLAELKLDADGIVEQIGTFLHANGSVRESGWLERLRHRGRSLTFKSDSA